MTYILHIQYVYVDDPRRQSNTSNANDAQFLLNVLTTAVQTKTALMKPRDRGTADTIEQVELGAIDRSELDSPLTPPRPIRCFLLGIKGSDLFPS